MKLKHPGSYAGIVVLMVISVLICSSFRSLWNSPVKGSVSPANAAIRVWVISKTDTLNSAVIQGSFMITNVKPGHYTLMVEARPPYKDSYKQDVLVADGQPTDVGLIEMNQ